MHNILCPYALCPLQHIIQSRLVPRSHSLAILIPVVNKHTQNNQQSKQYWPSHLQLPYIYGCSLISEHIYISTGRRYASDSEMHFNISLIGSVLHLELLFHSAGYENSRVQEVNFNKQRIALWTRVKQQQISTYK